jgi:hypothetical protein
LVFASTHDCPKFFQPPANSKVEPHEVWIHSGVGLGGILQKSPNLLQGSVKWYISSVFLV